MEMGQRMWRGVAGESLNSVIHRAVTVDHEWPVAGLQKQAFTGGANECIPDLLILSPVQTVHDASGR